MNFIMPCTLENKVLGDLCGDNFSLDRTAFIGCVGDGPCQSLYLVTYNEVFQANNPGLVWTDESTHIEIEWFVDLEIHSKKQY